MTIRELTVGPVATCCYILSEDIASSECLVIDPGAEPDRIRKACGPMRISAILLTHGHFDHIGAVSALMEESTRLLVHPLDAPMLSDPDLNVSRLMIRQSVRLLLAAPAPLWTQVLSWSVESTTSQYATPPPDAPVPSTVFVLPRDT